MKRGTLLYHVEKSVMLRNYLITEMSNGKHSDVEIVKCHLTSKIVEFVASV